MARIVRLHAVACIREKVLVGLVVRAAIIRVDRRLRVVVADDEIVVDPPVRGDDARLPSAEGSDVGNSIPRIPWPVVRGLTAGVEEQVFSDLIAAAEAVAVSGRESEGQRTQRTRMQQRPL